jgi:hypothetical protein
LSPASRRIDFSDLGGAKRFVSIVIDELKYSRVNVPEGSIRVCYIYNMGVAVKTTDVTEVTTRNRYTELKRVLDLDRFKP